MAPIIVIAMIVPEPWAARAVIACAMVPRGEVGLIFAELGRTGGILPQPAYAGLVLVIAATTLIAPFGLKALYRIDVQKSVVTT